MSKPLWESHMESAGIRVRQSLSRATFDCYVSMLGLDVACMQAEKAVGEFAKAYADIQPSHQGKRKQGTRNPYGTQYGGR